jgi:tetratricopeptide (TPR) repeat protein
MKLRIALLSMGVVFGGICRLSLHAQVDRWSDLAGRAAQLMQQGKIAEALPVTQEALSVAENTFGKSHANYGLSLNAVGYAYLLMGNFRAAEEKLLAAEKTLTAALGPDNIQIGTPETNLAQLYYGQASQQTSPAEAAPYLERAEAMAKKVLALGERSFPAGDLKLAPLLDTLATIYVAQRRFADAKPLAERIVRLESAGLPVDHIEIARAQEKVAWVDEQTGDRAAAIAAYRAALRISEKTLGAQDPMTARLRESVQRLASSN